MQQTIVVTGASRGLGLAFVQQYLVDGHRVFALAREPNGAAGLQALVAEHGDRLTCVTCDIVDPESSAAAARAIGEATGTLDVLIQNAGISGRTGARFGRLDHADMTAVFETNVVGPVRLTEMLMPLLRRGSDPRVVLITSRMGSIGDNDSGGWWSYRISKAALNMAGKNLGLELAGTGIATLTLHPGWVRTDMGGAAAPLSPEKSVAGMRRVIADLSPGESGGFRDFSGAELPW